MNLRRPVLDLGCGRGEFATLALDGQIDTGVDLSPRQVARARKTGRYLEVIQADAAELPLPANHFRTVLAVSSPEHMHRPREVLAEACRVLKPGGFLVATIVLSDLHEHLFYPRVARRLWLTPLGALYRRVQDKLFAHRTMLSRETWEELAREAGFAILQSRQFFSPRAVAWWDALLPLALPYRLLAPLGIRFVVPFPGREKLARWILAMIERPGENDDEDGSVLFLLARKPPLEG